MIFSFAAPYDRWLRQVALRRAAAVISPLLPPSVSGGSALRRDKSESVANPKHRQPAQGLILQSNPLWALVAGASF
jgi:hypothetical protein